MESTYPASQRLSLQTRSWQPGCCHSVWIQPKPDVNHTASQNVSCWGSSYSPFCQSDRCGLVPRLDWWWTRRNRRVPLTMSRSVGPLSYSIFAGLRLRGRVVLTGKRKRNNRWIGYDQRQNDVTCGQRSQTVCNLRDSSCKWSFGASLPLVMRTARFHYYFTTDYKTCLCTSQGGTPLRQRTSLCCKKSRG